MKRKIKRENKKEAMTLATILEKIAPRIGAVVHLEPQWKIVGQITFKNGKKSYFRYSTLDLNSMGSSEIARDKDYANYFMERMKYPIVPGSKTFFSKSWAKAIGLPSRGIDAAYEHAKKIGFPVIVKPNSGSQGSAVALVKNKSEFYKASKDVFVRDKVMLVQQPVVGKDYRVVVLDDKIISAYQRIPLSVIGDGVSTIAKLLKIKQQNFVASGRDTRINKDDPRVALKLKHQGLTLKSVLHSGQEVYLLDNANLSTGGDSLDVTNDIHSEFAQVAIRLTKDMGLRLCGVDFMIEGDIKEKPRTYYILEINSAPGLDHYAKIGSAQEKIVEDLYLKVLEHMGKK